MWWYPMDPTLLRPQNGSSVVVQSLHIRRPGRDDAAGYDENGDAMDTDDDIIDMASRRRCE